MTKIILKIDQRWQDQIPRFGNTRITIPLFSNQYTYTINGKACDKGVSKPLRRLAEIELTNRLATRSKQGAWTRIGHQSGLNTDQIGEVNAHRKVIRGTATCWTRALYMDPNISTWLQAVNNNTTPIKNWNNNKELSTLMKQCPFCTEKSEGDLEHLHIFCSNTKLNKVREYCNTQIESALQSIYAEDENIKEQIEQAAIEAELDC
jgi:hypothetical protein